MPTGMASRLKPENEIQEVTVEIGEENPKPSGTIEKWIISHRTHY